MRKSVFFLAVLGVFPLFLSAGPQDGVLRKKLLESVQAAHPAGGLETEMERNTHRTGWPQDAVLGMLHAPDADGPQWDASKGKSAPESLAAPPAAPDANSANATGSKTESPKPAEPVSPPHEEGAPPAAEGTPKPVADASNGQSTYRIGEGDVLQISVWGERDASVPSGVVRPDGMITMPLIKDVHVAGLTTAEAEKLITSKLSSQIKAADVTVIVSQINSKKIFMVGGGIKKEGPIAYTYRMTVMQALSEAGGLTDYAKRKKIYVLRTENGRQFKLPFDYDAVLKGEHMELNIPLMPGDTVVVPNH